jgi:hypothetical protein
MIEDPRPLVFAIAHSCGLSTPLLRLYFCQFCQELIQAATAAEIEALASLHPARHTAATLFHLKHHQPPSPGAMKYRRSPPPDLYVINNDGAPNGDF